MTHLRAKKALTVGKLCIARFGVISTNCRPAVLSIDEISSASEADFKPLLAGQKSPDGALPAAREIHLHPIVNVILREA